MQDQAHHLHLLEKRSCGEHLDGCAPKKYIGLQICQFAALTSDALRYVIVGTVQWGL